MTIIKKVFQGFIALGLLAFMGITGYGVYLFVSSTALIEQRIINYNSPLTTQVFDRKGELVANLFANEHRIFVSFQDIPAHIIEALVATEDTAFFEHFGINPEAIVRAAIKDIKARAFVEGASTLTQQLIKLTLLTRDKTLVRKFKEVILAMKLEQMTTKEAILEHYLNEVYFGNGLYGIKTAAIGYFRKNLDELTPKEVAMLVGLPKAPSIYNPTKRYERSMTRANQVLSRLKTLGWIDTQTYRKAFEERPQVYNDSRTKNKAPYVIDYLKHSTKDTITDLYTGGYTFKLSIDLDIQDLAREVLQQGHQDIIDLEKTKQDSNDTNTSPPHLKTLNGALVSVDSTTGDILALVGGVDYKTSKFNRAHQAFRQPGSSIKPFIYQIALNKGYALNSKLVDITRTYAYQGKDSNLTWRPKNYSDNLKGLITLQEALVRSKNLATINLVTDIGLDVIYKGLTHFGFRKVPYDLSISLGSFGVSPLQMAEFYSIFANNGQKVKSRLILEAHKTNRNPITSRTQTIPIMNEAQAYLMSHVLQEVVKRGSGTRAYQRQIQLAGKTGTTNDNTDAWFVGFSPSIQTVVWYGNDSSKPMGEDQTGGKAAAPVFGAFYRRLLELQPHIPKVFKRPKGILQKDGYLYTTTSPIKQQEAPVESDLVF